MTVTAKLREATRRSTDKYAAVQAATARTVARAITPVVETYREVKAGRAPAYREAVNQYRENDDLKWGVGVKADADAEPPQAEVAENALRRQYGRIRAVYQADNPDWMYVKIAGDRQTGRGQFKHVPRSLLHAYTGEARLSDMKGYLLPVRKCTVSGRRTRPVLTTQMRLELGHDIDPSKQMGGTTFYK